jgi:predicted DNA-binding transcriptional regulator AlpA
LFTNDLRRALVIEGQVERYNERPSMGTTPSSLIQLLNEHQVAELLGVSVATMRRWRLLRQGPPFLKVGALCRYRMADVSAWLESRPSGGGHEGAGQ